MSQGGGTGRASPYPHTATLTNPCRPENLEENPRSQQRRCSTLKKYKIKDYSDMVKKGDLTVFGSLLTQFSMEKKKSLFVCDFYSHRRGRGGILHPKTLRVLAQRNAPVSPHPEH